MNTLEVRESMQTLPAFFQPLLTWFTSKPLSAQGKSYFKTGLLHVMTTCLVMSVGVVSAIILMQSHGFILCLLPLATILTVSSMRKLQVVIYHHCAHHHV